jgi:hypothetical protein
MIAIGVADQMTEGPRKFIHGILRLYDRANMKGWIHGAGQRVLLLLACSLMAGVGSGCSGLRASEEVPAGLDLSGEWHLAPGTREAARAALDAAIIAQHRREREARRRWQSDGQAPAADDPYSDLERAAPQPKIDKILRQLEDMALPVERFKLRQEADVLRFDYFDTREPRRLRPGATLATVFLDHDTANVECGWSGAAFVIQTRAEELLTMLERLELIDHGRKLRYSVKVAGSLTGSLKFESIYERVN